MAYYPVIFYALAAFAVVAIAMPLARLAAIKAGFVDNPGGRKKHKDPVPPIGGLVIFPVFIALGIAAVSSIGGFWYMVLAVVMLLVTGALDDRFGVRAYIKFFVQFLAAFLIVVPGQTFINNLGNLFGLGDLWLGWGMYPFSIIATVLLINALNLMDGLDGLASGLSFVVFGGLALCCALAGVGDYLLALAILMGALAGFLLYNLRHPFREKASVFLGDSGSLSLGLMLAWFSMNLGHSETQAVAPITVAWLLALPIWDTCGQFARRVKEGRHPFDADHHHFHHHFINVGMSVRKSTYMIILIAMGTGAIGIGGIMLGVPEAVLAYLWIACLFAHIYLSVYPKKMRRLIGAPGRGK